MDAEGRIVSPEFRAALIATMSDPLRTRVYLAVADRPGVTISQIAARIGEPTRRVRHRIELLLDAGILVVDGETAKRNVRERHFRVVVMPRFTEEDALTDEEQRKVVASIALQIVSDIGTAARAGTFGSHPDMVISRVSGEVDERGWEELSKLMVATTEEVEGIMVRSFARLETEGRPGLEAMVALLSFEAAAWAPGDQTFSGPRPSPWQTAAPDRSVRFVHSGESGKRT